MGRRAADFGAIGVHSQQLAAETVSDADLRLAIQQARLHRENQLDADPHFAVPQHPPDQLRANRAVGALGISDDQVGLPTIEAIVEELAKPGRDPRKQFEAVRFTEGVNEIQDLREGMVLEGVVTKTAMEPTLNANGKPRPWDIEYGFADGKLWLFQSRPFIGSDEVANLPALAMLDEPRAAVSETISLEDVVQ